MNMCPADWQSLGAENFDFFLEQTVVPALTEIIRTPLDTLGKNPSYWPKCRCDRKKCSFCWMEKNLSDLTEEKTYRLPVRTTDGMTDLEVKHTVVPLDNDNASITVSAMVQGTLHYYTSDSTEKNLLALARNLPEGWHIKSCISCRHGHFCPVGNGDNELFCITDFEPKAPCDLWSVTEDDTQRKIRSRTLFDCCDQYREQSADYFTYSDYYDTINKPKS